MKQDIRIYLSERKDIIDKKLLEYFPLEKNSNYKLNESIKYSINSDGKRLRPILCLSACELISKDYSKAIPVACAIEMIHTYSLIHDDLPSMDNDDLRRGKPTNHKIYGEAIAILAGDALLTDSFGLVVEESIKNNLSDSVIVELILNLSKLAGSSGMVLGQAIDLSLEGSKIANKDILEKVHQLKTGKMIEASVVLGALVAGADSKQISSLQNYSMKIGLAFQIIDDILDVKGGSGYGKNLGSDAKKNKPTYSSLEGIEKSISRVKQLTQEAVEELSEFNDDYNPLKEIAYFLSERVA